MADSAGDAEPAAAPSTAAPAAAAASGAEGSVGWDSSVLDANAAAPAPAPAAAAKPDANDYSRFAGIGDDEPAAAKPAAKKAAPAPALCGNCRAPDARQKCSICKKVVYCNRECQRDDWRFHRRTCKKPAAAKKKSSSAPAPAPAAAAKAKATPKPRAPANDVVTVDDEDDLKDLKGYRYFSRTLPQEETELIGSIAPQKIDAGASAAAAPAAAAAAAAADSTPQPLPAGAPMQRQSSASAWNAVGTWEDRDQTPWVKQRLTELLTGASFETAEGATVTLASVKKLEGDAQIAVVRGTNRYLYDFADVKFKWEATVDGCKAHKGTLVIADLSNDADELECRVEWAKRADDTPAMRRAVATPGEGLQALVAERVAQFFEEFQQRV